MTKRHWVSAGARKKTLLEKEGHAEEHLREGIKMQGISRWAGD
jgi:hypothetical protein